MVGSLSSVVDPDPAGSELIRKLGPGSGFGSELICKLGPGSETVINFGFGSGFESGTKSSSVSHDKYKAIK
jgi:hypothetical protein